MAMKRRFVSGSGREILDFLIEIAYLAVIFLVPLWFAYIFPTFNIFEFNKSVLFKLLTWLLLLGTLVKIIFYPPSREFLPTLLKRYWLVPAVLTAAWALTLVTSLNPVLSFFGTPERQGGLANDFYYCAFFILLVFNILTVNNTQARGEAAPVARNLRRAIGAAALSGALVALYAVLQIFNIDFLAWPEAPYLTGRALSTFGQPNFLASWLLLVLPLSVHLAMAAGRSWRRWLWILAAVLQFCGLVASGSRGGLLALFGAILAWLVYLLASVVWPRRRKIAAVIAFIIFSLAAAWLLDYASHGRLQELKNLDYGSFGARRNFYAAAIDAIAGRPWLGYGPETGSEIFIRYYAPDWGLYGNVGQSADRAHNIILDKLLNGGLFGLLLTIALYYFFFRLAWRNMKSGRGGGLSLALALGVLGYLFSLFLSFQIVAGEVYFWAFLALLAVLDFQGNPPAAPLPSVVPVRPWRSALSWPLALLLLILVAWRVERLVRAVVADYYFNAAYLSLPAADYPTTLELESYAKEQAVVPPLQESYDYKLGYQLSELYSGISTLTPQQFVRDYLRRVDERTPAAGYQNLFLKGKINLALQNHLIADSYLSRVAALSPHWPPVLLEQGELAAVRQDFPAALAAYDLAARNLPDVSDSRLPAEHRAAIRRYLYLIEKGRAAAYEAQQDYAAAAEHYLAAYDSKPEDFTLLKKVADTYYYRGDLAAAIKYVARGLSRNPADYHWPLALAALYYESGDPAAAAGYLKAARLIAPAAAAAELDGLAAKYQALP